MKVVIVGGGISGLTLALALGRSGHEVSLFEKADLQEKTGLGVGLQAFAVKALFDLGLSNLVDQGVSIRKTGFYTKEGKTLYIGNVPDLPRECLKLGIRRFALQDCLLSAVEKMIENRIYPQHELLDFEEQDGCVSATFKHSNNNSTLKKEADLLVGADGLHSRVRSILFPNDNTLKFSGITTWRGFTHHPSFLKEEMVLMGGRAAKTVIYPLKHLSENQTEYYWAAEVLQENKSFSGTANNRKGHFSEFVKHFEGFNFRGLNVANIYRASHKVLKFPIVDKDPIKSWSSSRSILIGDSAHPMYPMGGNGASQAIVDAVTLSSCLNKHATFQEAFSDFEKKRVDKVNKVVMNNRKLGPDRVLTLAEEMNQMNFDPFDSEQYKPIVDEYKVLTTP